MLNSHKRQNNNLNAYKSDISLELNSYSINHHTISNSTLTQTFRKNYTSNNQSMFILNNSERSPKRNLFYKNNLNSETNSFSKNEYIFKTTDNNFSCDKVKRIRLKLNEDLKDQKLFLNKIKRKDLNETEKFYINSLLKKKKLKNENKSKNNINLEQTKTISDSFSIYNPEIKIHKFLPSVYQNENLKLISKNRGTIQIFKDSIDGMRKSKYKKSIIDEVLKSINENDENEKIKLNVIKSNIKINNNLLEKYIKSFGKYILELNKISDDESYKLYTLNLELIKKKREVKELKFNILKLIQEKKRLCKYKVLFFQMKYNIKDLNQIKDKNLLKEYGLDNLKRIKEDNKYIYYDDTNDNNNEYKKIINPPIFENIENFDEIFHWKQLRILDLCIYYNENRNFKTLLKELEFQNEIYNSSYNDIINELNLTQEKLNDIKFLYDDLLLFRNNLYNQYEKSEKESKMFNLKNQVNNIIKHPLIQNHAIKHFHLNYDFLKTNEIYKKKKPNILMDSLLFYENLINLIMDEEIKYKNTEYKMNLYINAKKKYLVIKGIMKNKKYVEEMRVKRENQIENILNKNDKIIIKPIRKIENKPKVKINVKLIKKRNNSIQPEINNINEKLYNLITY